MKRVQFVGLDVHADTIAVAVAEPDGTVRSVGVMPNRPESIRKLVKRLGSPDQLRACYEAGPTGYVLYWQLTALGVRCEVVAPTLVPVKAGDRVKTDRRDALKLARSYRAGDLTPVWVPDAAHEALRDVVRAREAAKKDQLRARHRLGKFLLRHGRRPPTGITRWTQRYLEWVKCVRFTEAAQEATLLDYLHEVEHMAARLERLEDALDEAVQTAPAPMRVVIDEAGAGGAPHGTGSPPADMPDCRWWSAINPFTHSSARSRATSRASSFASSDRVATRPGYRRGGDPPVGGDWAGVGKGSTRGRRSRVIFVSLCQWVNGP